MEESPVPAGAAGTEKDAGTTVERSPGKGTPGEIAGSSTREPGRTVPETTFPNSTRQKI